MILADTSIWIDHLRDSDPLMQMLLEAEQIVTHPYVIGEIALGFLPKRVEILTSLAEMPTAVLADPVEVLALIEQQGLHATGVGYVDVHLLASALLGDECRLWTRDKRLQKIAERMDVATDLG